MNKEDAIRELAQLEERKAALERIINGPDSLIYSRDFHVFDHYLPGVLESGFQSNAIAQEYKMAIETLLRLRAMPGTVKPTNTDTKNKAVLVATQSKSASPAELSISVDDAFNNYPFSSLSPCFRDWDAANNAVEIIGTENLIHMFRTLHGVYDCDEA